jgi:hypothetical protein
MAAVHYVTLFGKSPVGAAGPAEVSQAALPVLQSIAWATASGYVSGSGRRDPALSECRARIATELCPAYYRFTGRPEQVAQCASWATSDSPMAQAELAPEPAPAPSLAGWGSAAAALLLAGLGYIWQSRRG